MNNINVELGECLSTTRSGNCKFLQQYLNVDLVTTVGFPSVFIAPIPEEFNEGLLSKCSNRSAANTCERLMVIPRNTLHLTTSSHVFAGDFEQNVSDCTASQCTYMQQRNMYPVTEYDQDVFFHRFLQQWVKRVYTPSEADLIYVPIYRSRLFHHDSIKALDDIAGLRRRLSALVAPYTKVFPTKKLFTTVAQVCSCEITNTLCQPCNVLLGEVAQHMQIVSWETSSVGTNEVKNVVYPYMTKLVNVSTSHRSLDSSTRVLYAGNPRSGRCTYCGICGKRGSKGKCLRGCANVRPFIERLMIKYSSETVRHMALAEGLGNIHKQMARSTFCIQPPGDTLTRKSFYESVILGCIPVVFRNDSMFVSQLAFSSVIPWSNIFLYIEESRVLSGVDIIHDLLNMNRSAIAERQKNILQHKRMITFSTDSYNDISNPDAFAMTLQELSREPIQTSSTSTF